MTLPATHEASPARFTTHVRKSRSEVEAALALEIAELIRADRRAGRGTVLGLATGQTPVGVYEELIRLHRDEGLDFSSVTTFNLDEYVGLAPDDPGSFRAFMWRVLFDHVNVPADRIHIPDGAVGAEGATRHSVEFEQAIERAGGIDLQLLGIGGNGHVAFNEPGATRRSRTRLVPLADRTRRDAEPSFGGLERVPQHAITMGVETIMEARRLRVLAFGEGKAEIVRRAAREAIGPEVPATFLREHKDVELWLDAAAASEL